MILKFIKRYLVFCGLVVNVLLLYSVYSFSKNLVQEQSLPGVIYKSAGKLANHASTRSMANVLMKVGDELNTPIYYWKPFDRNQWPMVGPNDTTPPVLPVASEQTISVNNASELLNALKVAEPGTTIVVADGEYDLNGKRFKTSTAVPSKYHPIVVKAEHPGKVTLSMTTLEGIYLSKPYWTIAGFKFIGQCTNHNMCEHAIHIVGDAQHTSIMNNEFIDFNAAIKVNRFSESYPDDGLVSYNYFYFTKPRNTTYSVTPVNIDHANHWRVSHNIIRDFIKLGGNKTSYGAFMKGGATGGVIENNLVVCNSSQQHYPGSSIGLSAGGGGMRDRRGGVVYQTNKAVIRNNIIFHCSDVGIYVNGGQNTLINNNTLYNTAGIDIRFPQSSAVVLNNLFSGHLMSRDGGKIAAKAGNLIYPRSFITNSERLNNLFLSPETGNFKIIDDSQSITKKAVAYPLLPKDNTSDFCGEDIHKDERFIGAFRNRNGCFYPSN